MSTVQPTGVSQLLFLRLRENRWSKLLERVMRETPPGGVLLSEPLPRTAEETQAFTSKIRRACTRPVFIAIRQDGGDCDPLSRYFPGLPSPRAVANKGPDAVGRWADLIGEALALLGINTNFAPSLDLASHSSAKDLGTRAFGIDPHQVTECGRAFVRGLARHKILSCGKHFPGRGSVPCEQTAGLRVSAKPMAVLWSEDLLPFRRLLPRLPMVLISSAAYKAYDFDIPRPASLSSSIVQGLLREKLRYRGLALAYDLESSGVHGALGFDQAVIQSVESGCDMIVVDQGTHFASALQVLETGTQSGRFPAPRVAQALRRIRSTAKRIPPMPPRIATRAVENLQDRFENFSSEFAGEESDHA
jgi:beta-N-acetylhexosaminidase